MSRLASKIILAAAVALCASTATSADIQGRTHLDVDTTVIDGLIEDLGFLNDGKSIIVAGSNKLRLFQTFPTFETSSIALDTLELSPTSLFVDRLGYLYVMGTSPKKQEGRLLVLDSQNMAIAYNITIERPFSNPFVSVSESGHVVISDLASGSLSLFENMDEMEKAELQTLRRAPLVVNLSCGPSLQASWLEGIGGGDGAIISSPFGGGTLEIVKLGATRERCEPAVDIRPFLPEGSVVTTISHAVVRSDELVFAGSMGTDQVFVLGSGGRLFASTETGLHLSRFSTDKPNVKGDVHVVADDTGGAIVVASPNVARVSVFAYRDEKIERVGTGSIDHTVDGAAISRDGAVVAVAGSNGGQGKITLLRNPLGLHDVEVDYRRPFTTQWAQRVLQAQGYDPGGIDGTMGRRTAAAIKQFQAANGITVDGRLNAETLKMLYVKEAKAE